LAVVAFIQHQHQLVDLREPRRRRLDQLGDDSSKGLGILAIAPVESVKQWDTPLFVDTQGQTDLTQMVMGVLVVA